MPSSRLSVILWIVSIPIVSLGARLRETSPQYEQWFQAMTADMRLADGAGLGAALSTWWLFVMLTWVIGLAFLACSLAIGIKLSGNGRISSSQRLIIKAVFAAALGYPAILLAKDVISALCWQFPVLGLGQCVSFIALLIGILALLATKPKCQAPNQGLPRDGAGAPPAEPGRQAAKIKDTGA